MQGGFIWDLIDQGLLLKDKSGYGYGGDFDDYPNTAQFCINGILGPDRVPHPIAYEAAALQSPVTLELKIILISPNSYKLLLHIENRRSFLDLSDLKIQLSLGTNLSPTSHQSMPFSIHLNEFPTISPRSSAEIDITFCLENLLLEYLSRTEFIPIVVNDITSTLSEAWLKSSIQTIYPTEYFPVGHQISAGSHFHPLLLPSILPHLPEEAKTKRFNVSDRDSDQLMKIKLNEVDLDKKFMKIEWSSGNYVLLGHECGRLVSWMIQGENMLLLPIDLCLWRAPTDNDR